MTHLGGEESRVAETAHRVREDKTEGRQKDTEEENIGCKESLAGLVVPDAMEHIALLLGGH